MQARVYTKSQNPDYHKAPQKKTMLASVALLRPGRRSSPTSKRLASSLLILPQRDLAISVSSAKSGTTLWCHKGHLAVRVTLPLIIQLVQDPTCYNVPMLALLPQFEQKGFYSKWVTSVSHLSNLVSSLLYRHVYEFSFIGYNYGVEYSNRTVVLSLGLSHSQVLPIPYGVFVEIFNKRQLKVFSFSRAAAAQFSSTLGELRHPNAYTGKGLVPLFRNFVVKKTKTK